jgi:hypothetical protein
MHQSIYVALLLFAWAAGGSARAQAAYASDGTTKPAQASSRSDGSINQVIDRIVAREQDETVAFRRFHPIVETYIQNRSVRAGEARLTGDFYLLGQATLMADYLAVTPMVQRKGQRLMNGQFMSDYDSRGFLQEVYVDPDVFDRDYYEFHFVGREFLGNVRCLVFDISPRRSRPGTAHFHGRIWAEDRDFTIVRFNGKFYPGGHHIWYGTAYPHFDSWRVNAQPGLWLPAYIFSEETPYKGDAKSSVGFEAQTRFWGYNLRSPRHQGDSRSQSVESLTPARDDTPPTQHDYPPLQAQRNWRTEAETSALDARERTGFLATPGDVDEALNAVLNNLEATNHIEIEPGVRCRVLTTSSLEIFTIGHTIVVSRGLIDVFPDKTTLAILLAQELASVMDSNNVSDRYGFDNAIPIPAINVPALKVLKHFQFRVPARDQSAYGERALAIVRNSSYAANLGSARLFFEQLHKQSRVLPQLIRPSLANEVYRVSQLLESATAPQPGQDQIVTFPMGDRVELDPWSDKAELLKTPPARPEGTRGNLPFEVAPFVPFLTRYGETAGLNEATSAPMGAAR